MILLLYRLNLNNGACANSTPAVVKLRDRRKDSLKIYIFNFSKSTFARTYFYLLLFLILFVCFSIFFARFIISRVYLTHRALAKAGITGSFGNSRRGLKRIPNRWRLDPTAVTRYTLRLYLRDYLHERNSDFCPSFSLSRVRGVTLNFNHGPIVTPFFTDPQLFPTTLPIAQHSRFNIRIFSRNFY